MDTLTPVEYPDRTVPDAQEIVFKSCGCDTRLRCVLMRGQASSGTPNPSKERVTCLPIPPGSGAGGQQAIHGPRDERRATLVRLSVVVAVGAVCGQHARTGTCFCVTLRHDAQHRARLMDAQSGRATSRHRRLPKHALCGHPTAGSLLQYAQGRGTPSHQSIDGVPRVSARCAKSVAFLPHPWCQGPSSLFTHEDSVGREDGPNAH